MGHFSKASYLNGSVGGERKGDIGRAKRAGPKRATVRAEHLPVDSSALIDIMAS